MKQYDILLVDDQPQELQILFKYLSEIPMNLNIMIANNGESAYEIANNHIPSLIITDWEMPVMNGIELIKKLKQNIITADIPVIMCTGKMLTSEHLEEALLAGAVDYVRKPVDNIELRARVGAMLRLSDSYNEIKKLNEIKDKLFTVISHDLRGPVGNAKSSLEIILQYYYENKPPNISLLEMAFKNLNATFILLDNLLNWGRSQHNILDIVPKFCSLSEVVTEILLLYRYDIERKNLNIENKLSLKDTVYADNGHLTLILRNLIANALKFTPLNGSITVSATSDIRKNICYITIKDSGVGISEEVKKTLFQKNSFYSTYGTDYEKGTGLGLKLCYDFVIANKGTISVESKENEGSSFIIGLPLLP